MLKWLLSFLFCLTTIGALASPGQLVVKGGTWSFATENVGATSETSSGVGAYAVELGYRFSPSWLVVFGMNLVLSDFVQGSSGYGFDIGTRYYPLTASGTDSSSTDSVEMTIQEVWRPYVGLFLRQRIFGLALSTSYLGPGVSIGLDYSLSEKWFLNAEFRYDNLNGQGDAVATQSNILIGIGYEF